MRKQLELIFTALLPVMVLIVGFFAVNSRASIWDFETADPSGAAPFYRDARHHGVEDPENPDAIYFGTEIYSSDLCGSTTPELDITYTYESASIYASSPEHVHWDRSQSWGFNTSETDWETDYANISLSKDYHWDSKPIREGGFPWSGSESHYREHNEEGMIVTVQADVTRWSREYFNNSRFMCPSFVKTVSEGYFYRCDDGTRETGDEYTTDDDDILHAADTHPYYPNVLSRWAEIANVHHLCIRLE